MPAVRRRTSFPCIAVNLLPQQDTGQGPCPARPWKKHVRRMASLCDGLSPYGCTVAVPRTVTPATRRCPPAGGSPILLWHPTAEDLRPGAGGQPCQPFAEGCRSHSEHGEESRMLDLFLLWKAGGSISCMKESVHWGGRPEEILLERDSPRSSVMPLEYARMLLFRIATPDNVLWLVQRIFFRV